MLRPHDVQAGQIPLRARRGGPTSLVLKVFLIVGTVGLIAWAGVLPDDPESETPVGWNALLTALIAAALALLVLRLMRRTEPLVPHVVRGVKRLRANGPVVDAVADVLTVLAVLGYLLTVVMLIVVAVVAVLWNGHVPVAIGVGPFCVSLGATIGLWVMGRAEFPGGV